MDLSLKWIGILPVHSAQVWSDGSPKTGVMPCDRGGQNLGRGRREKYFYDSPTGPSLLSLAIALSPMEGGARALLTGIIIISI
jgi:hypothetical protein